MTAFTPKKLPLEETIGEKLRQSRHYKNLKIEEIAKKLKIRPEYLRALEEERFDNLPAGLYGKNFLKEYAHFLGLKPAAALTSWEEKMTLATTTDPFSQKIVKKGKFIIFPKIVRNSLIVLAIIICLLFLVGYLKKIVFPPELIMISPAQNLLTATTSLIVSGQTELDTEVKINNEIVLNNHNGFFSQTINLKKGLNSLIITAKKKYSQERMIIRQILVE